MPIQDWEETLQCPYDKNHKILPIRMVTHLYKCARQVRNYPLMHKFQDERAI